MSTACLFLAYVLVALGAYGLGNVIGWRQGVVQGSAATRWPTNALTIDARMLLDELEAERLFRQLDVERRYRHMQEQE